MKFKKPKGDIFWVSLLWAMMGLVIVINMAMIANPILPELPFSLAAPGILLLLAAVLVWFDAKWIAWPLIVFYGLGFVLRVGLLFVNGVTLLGLGRLALPIWIAYALYQWRYPEEDDEGNGDSDEEDDIPILSFVALLKEHVYLDGAILATVAQKAWGAELSYGDDLPEDDDSESGDGFVVGESPLCFVQYDGRMMMINSHETPYVEDVEAAADDIKDLRLRSLFAEHRAWLSCDATMVDAFDDEQEVREWYRLLGRLMAELVDDNCLAIFLPLSNHMFPNMPETLEKLRADDPVAELLEDAPIPIVPVQPDDPRMAAAVEEAKARINEFITAYESGEGENFGVKAPITRGDNTEFIWVEVTAIENAIVYGKIGNDPFDLPGLAYGSQVRLPIESVEDWVYIDANDEPVGLFSEKVIRDVQNGE